MRRSVHISIPISACGRAANAAPESSSDYYSVETIGLAAVYSRVPVLHGIDLAVAQGESIAVMGPNGAGKSTLLKCLMGIVRPAAGRVCWFGEATTRCNFVRRQIGYVGQEYGLYAELTAAENLVFAGRMYGVAQVHDRVRGLLEEAGLEPHADRAVAQLSQGVRQRLAIARALVHEPRLLVLDEPSSSLDAKGRHWLERLFQRWRQEQRTVCFASHDVPQSRVLADRVVWLDAGRIVAIEPASCTPKSLLRSA